MGKTNDEVVTISWAHALLVLGKATRFLGSSIPFEAKVLRMNRLRMSGLLIWNYVFDMGGEVSLKIIWAWVAQFVGQFWIHLHNLKLTRVQQFSLSAASHHQCQSHSGSGDTALVGIFILTFRFSFSFWIVKIVFSPPGLFFLDASGQVGESSPS